VVIHLVTVLETIEVILILQIAGPVLGLVVDRIIITNQTIAKAKNETQNQILIGIKVRKRIIFEKKFKLCIDFRFWKL
jgi:hypothetical protein